ncbi:MAG: glycosyltransferase family 4 protein [Candidatus Omnitrophica bacterium]|nr:glycosyltransferase family 4 protein [Candidatus Omnitrophota bacterium]
MKILLVHPHDIFDHHEPWTIRIENIAREFVRMGHTVKLIHFLQETSIEKHTRHPYGFEVISLRRRGEWKRFMKNFREILTEIEWADIVHFQKCFHYVSLPVLFGCYKFRKPVHYDWDDLEEAIYETSAHPPSRYIHFFLNTFERILPTMVDTVSVASAELRRKCVSLGIPSQRIFNTPVGADLGTFNGSVSGERIKKRFNAGGKLVVYIGQLNGAQYTHLFVKAVSKIREKNPHTRYLIIGSGSKSRDLQELAKCLKVDDAIMFLGALRHEMVPQYLAAADIAVACFEDNEITRCKSPLKVVEYLSAGKAIVASAVGEVKTMLEGCGILVKPGSSDALAEGVQRLLNDDTLIETMGLLARQKAEEKYNWPRVAKELINAYAVALGKKKSIALEMNGYAKKIVFKEENSSVEEIKREEIIV